MTIAAFRRLLDEIDHEGGPTAARHNRLHLLSERTRTVTTAPATRPTAPMPPLAAVPQQATSQPPNVPVGALLKWGDEHPDPTVQDQAARARIALHGLRQRHAADQELTAITTEAEQLEQRLAELRAREAQLTPAKPKKRTAVSRDYDTRTVRTWAAAHGVDCPRVGQIPKRVLDAWRAARTQPTT